MKIETRKSSAGEWKTAAQDLIQYYFDTTDSDAIKSMFGSKKVIKKMNLYFRITK